MSSFESQLKLLVEELENSNPSLPDNANALFRKISIAFPKMKHSIGLISAKVIHGHIIFMKCKDFNVYFTRSKREYSKIDMLVKKNGRTVDEKQGVFFEEFERILMSMIKPVLNEYEVGDLDKNKPISSIKKNSNEKRQKIGTNSSVVKGVASSMTSAMDAVKGYPDMEKDVISNANNSFEDLDKVINTGAFRTAVGDSQTYSRIKKAHEDNKNKK